MSLASAEAEEEKYVRGPAGGLGRGEGRAVGLSCCFRDYRDMDLTFHAALSLAQGLGGTRQYGCQQGAQ